MLKLWQSTGLPASFLSRLHLLGDPDSAINSSFRLGLASQTAIGLAALSATYFHFLRSGVDQTVSVDARHAVLDFHSEVFYTLEGKSPGPTWDSIAGLYKTKDDSYVRIHTNFPHHRQGILSLLSLPNTPSLTRTDVESALLGWNAEEFETAAAAGGMCATALRSIAQWDTHPQRQALSGVPPVQIIKIGDAPKRTSGPFTRPLEGIRILDLSRVLAGPIAGRTLAAHGADVLWLTSPHLPALPTLDIDTSRLKRTAQLDLTSPAAREKLRALASSADVFLQAYRPGGLAEKGFGATDLAALRPGIVVANLTAWGWDGPWKDRRGFDSLVQTATGFNAAEGEAYHRFHAEKDRPVAPRPLPMQALDHAAAYFLAFGVNAALCKTVTEGGSYEVRVSLAAVGEWVKSLGRLEPEQAFGVGKAFPESPKDEEIVKLSSSWRNGGQEMTAVRHAPVLEHTPVLDTGRAPMGRLDVDEAEWSMY
ncbi:CoA-transferase family III domain-containing protein [Roridomyces roridus]|uniref:CoA-transferase family III domain-containing protein n=1 Tax=Roridomyces roridus TaxID=1738132 RepID=A0AAD7CBJ5_9AGAR|nr:CoA-transferase family III domain-containing protein [Roridomyces roridus]